MDKVTFIYKYWRKLLRNHLDDLRVFVGYGKRWNRENKIFNWFINTTYTIDNDIEYFIRNGRLVKNG